MKLVNWFMLLFLGTCALLSHAEDSKCPSHYYDGHAPEVLDAKMQHKSREICFTGFVVLHSGVTRTPLWSAEHLLKENLQAGSQLERIDYFHPEYTLPENERAEIKDYVGTGYDRGHLSPSFDMPSRKAQQESFSLANIVPQNPNNNRILWRGIESAVRSLAKRKGEIYVITGVLFDKKEDVILLNHRVIAPSHLYKIVFDPKNQRSAAYIADNIATREYKVISVAELERMVGINFFPGIDQTTKSKVMALPKPNFRKPRSSDDFSRGYSNNAH